MSVLSATTQQQVEDSIVHNHLMSQKQLDDLKDKAKQERVPFISLLVSEGHLSSEQLTKLIAKSNNIPYVNLSDSKIDPAILKLLPKDVAEHFMAVPLGEMQHRLVVAMLDAGNVQAVDFLSNKIGRPLKVYAASEEGIRSVLKQYQVSLGQDIEGSIKDADLAAGGNPSDNVKINEMHSGETDQSKDKDNIGNVVHDSPISKALSTILEYAAKNRASDVHIEPRQNTLRIRCRIDGVLREMMELPKSIEPPLISRIKILSNLKIDEHRIPQDGQFTLIADNREIDLRVSISPIVWGEQIVIRLLDKTGTSLKLEDMGYKGRALRTIRKGLKQSSGMILTSGPTGSGKSTSMYALLQEIKNDTINIVTLEDPVEYKMEGINQIQVNPEVGLTFSTGLRSILRQDPDVVMVGEIRDKETAELAVQAALTGHLVFSTLHTNSAAGILPRLLDMEVEPFLIASTVRTVIGQRLVRRIADNHTTYESDVAETESINETVGHLLPLNADELKKVDEDLGFENLPLRGKNAYTLTKGIDSIDTPGGYKGRLGLYEVFNITEEIQELILKRATSSEIQKVATQQGMVTMREDGYLKALAGITTLSEANRVAAADNE
jgi:type IV pilus assembly protein PilB